MDIKNPCGDCKKEEMCHRNGRYRDCRAWRKWFSAKWREIRKKFGVKCVDLTLEEEECDNENS